MIAAINNRTDRLVRDAAVFLSFLHKGDFYFPRYKRLSDRLSLRFVIAVVKDSFDGSAYVLKFQNFAEPCSETYEETTLR